MLNRVSSTDNLNVNDLRDNEQGTKVCLVLNVRAGMSVYEKGYYTFFVKDECGNILPARLFNVKDFKDKGFDALYFKGKPVKLEFLAQRFNNQWSLLIDNISIHTGEFDYSKFYGKLSEINLDGVYKIINSTLTDYVIPEKYKTKSYMTLYGGRTGGALHLYVNLIRGLLIYKDLPSVVLEELIGAATIAYEVYISFLEKKDDFEIISNKEIFDILSVADMRFCKYNFCNVSLDIARSLLGLTKPQHLYSHLVVNTLNNIIQGVNLIYENSLLPLGSGITIGSDQLLRY